jgi:hypothetical protein
MAPTADLAVGGGLNPGGAVDGVAEDHPLASRPERGGHLAGDDAATCSQPGDAGGLPQLGHGGHEVKGGPDGPLGVVLVGDRYTPYGHDGVADELLDRPPVVAHDRLGPGEVGREDIPYLFGVAPLD